MLLRRSAYAISEQNVVVKPKEEEQRLGSQDTKRCNYRRRLIGHEDKSKIDAIVVNIKRIANAEKYTMLEQTRKDKSAE